MQSFTALPTSSTVAVAKYVLLEIIISLQDNKDKLRGKFFCTNILFMVSVGVLIVNNALGK